MRERPTGCPQSSCLTDPGKDLGLCKYGAGRGDLDRFGARERQRSEIIEGNVVVRPSAWS